MSLLHRSRHLTRLPSLHHRQFLIRPLLSNSTSSFLSSQQKPPPDAHPRHPHHRQFSVHAAASTLVDTAESLILSLNSYTGLPWLYTVPIAALILRISLTLPFSIYSHHRTNKMLELQPLIDAWQKTIMKRSAAGRSGVPIGIPPNKKKLRFEDNVIVTNEGVKEEKGKLTPQEWIRQSAKEVRKKRKEIYKHEGAQAWRAYVGLIQVPIWITASLAIRRLTGRDVEGMWFGIGERRGGATEAMTETAESISPTIHTSSKATTEIATPAVEAPTSIAEAPTSLDPEALAEAARASMSLESIPNWFPSLLEPDPLYILPLLFSLSIFLNVELLSYFASTRAGSTGEWLRNGIRIISVVIFPFTMNQPVVLHLYWCSSAMYSVVQNIVLEKVWPRPPSFKIAEDKGTPLEKWVRLPLSEQDKPRNYRTVNGRKVFIRKLDGLDVAEDDWMAEIMQRKKITTTGKIKAKQ